MSSFLFVETLMFSGALQAKAIQRLIVSLCSELRGAALPLVSAFNIPDHILRAPIGLGANSGVDIYKEYLAAVGFDV